jgi:hypothetical protein
VRERLIILALALPAMTSPALAIDVRCPPNAIKVLDGRGLERTSRSTKRTQCMIFPRTLMGVVRSKSFVLETLM